MSQPRSGVPTGPPPWRPVLAVLGVMLPVALRALLRPDLEVYDQRDEDLFHLPTILGFARALPWPDLSDYPSATTPLYHLLLAPLARLTGEALLPLRLATLLFAVGLVVAAGGLLARRSAHPAWGTWLLLLPLALSPYVLGPAVRLSTDDAALAWVIACLWALDRGREGPGGLDPRAHLLAAGLATAAILTRQVHGWLVGLLALLPLLATGLSPPRRLLHLLAAGLPALALLPLVLLWGGATPPSFAEHQAGLNLAVLQTELAVLGALGLAVAPWLLRALAQVGPRAAGAAGGGALALGLGLMAAAPLPWVEDPLRYGGSLWRVAGALPDLGGSTAVFWLLVPLGLLWTAAIVGDGRARRDPLPAAALLLFLVANLASARAYQKYYEPFLLVLLGWVVARSGPMPRMAWLGPAALAAAWLGVALLRFVR
ncbi:hypothetical protein L6R53_27040 [Myxococcota bacterium]|nr:hypothetical protein [Myxococcota bacterium]